MAGLEITSGKILLKNDSDNVMFTSEDRNPHIIGSVSGTLATPSFNVTLYPVVDWFSNYIFTQTGQANDTPAFNLGYSGGAIERAEFVLDNGFQYLLDTEILLIPYFKVNGNNAYSSHAYSQASSVSPHGTGKWTNGQGGIITRSYCGDLGTAQLTNNLGNSIAYAKIVYDGQYKLVIDHVSLLSGFSGVLGGFHGASDLSGINSGLLGNEPNTYTPTGAGLDLFFGVVPGTTQLGWWETERCGVYYGPSVRADASPITKTFNPNFTVDFKVYYGMYI